MFYAIIKNEVKKMIDQEQAARTLINLIDVVHQENWVLLNNEDMASKTEEYYINFFKEHHLEEAIDEIATMAFLMNEQTENIGARRLHTILEKLLEDISFNIPDMEEEKIVIDQDYVKEKFAEKIHPEDIDRYIL